MYLVGRLPGLNDILAGSASASRGWSSYNALKQKWTGDIGLVARTSGLAPLGSGYFSYLFVEPTSRRDPSNVVSGGVKIIEDALQKAGLLPGDDWRYVLGFIGHWTLNKGRAGCLVCWSPDEMLTKPAMLALLALLEKEQTNDGREKEASRGSGSNRPGAFGDGANRAHPAGGTGLGRSKPHRQLRRRA